MRTRFLMVGSLALALLGWPLATSAYADGPTSTPSATPPPASPTPSPTSSREASPSPSGSPKDSTPSASVGPAASPTPAPSATPSPDDVARDAAAVASARSLAQLIAAQAQLARDELASLAEQIARTAADLDAVNTEIAALQAQADARRANPDRLQREAFRLVDLPASAIPADLSAAQREALDELRALSNGLESEQQRLAERSTRLARLQETVAAKRTELDRSRVRAQQLAAAAANGDSDAKQADLAVLRALANDVAASQTSLAQLVASSLAKTAGSAPGTWTLPVQGTITQPFGPTAFPLEPAAVYQGVYFEHFHGAIDIAAAFGTPVAVAADGVVTYVGHLPDGAEIVLAAHAGGLVSEYAHLEDTVLPPTVKVGDDVTGGEVIGYVGLTGITTGAHVHFAVMRDGLAIDPLSLIAK